MRRYETNAHWPNFLEIFFFPWIVPLLLLRAVSCAFLLKASTPASTLAAR